MLNQMEKSQLRLIRLDKNIKKIEKTIEVIESCINKLSDSSHLINHLKATLLQNELEILKYKKEYQRLVYFYKAKYNSEF